MNPTNTQLLSLIYGEQVQPAIIDQADENTMYIGYPLPTCTGYGDSRWLIKRVQTNGTLQTIMYPNGSRKYDQSWLNRTNLTYKHNPNF